MSEEPLAAAVADTGSAALVAEESPAPVALVSAHKLYKRYRMTANGNHGVAGAKAVATIVEVLKGLDLTVDEGELVAVVGQSGAGKSTLLHLLGALDTPTSGEVRFAGVSLGALSNRDLAQFRNRHIGFVFQFHHLLPEFTAMENVEMPVRISGIDGATARTAARTALELVSLEHRLYHRPSELSGGEQQRVALARAIVMGPRAILADEPTGNLDSRTSGEVHDVMRWINRTLGVTFIIATHDERLAGKADRIVRIADGLIVQ